VANPNSNLPYPVAVGDDDTENAQTTFAGSTSALTIPVGTTAQRPASPMNGQIRFNLDTMSFEGYVNGQWLTFLTQPSDAILFEDGQGIQFGDGSYVQPG